MPYSPGELAWCPTRVKLVRFAQACIDGDVEIEISPRCSTYFPQNRDVLDGPGDSWYSRAAGSASAPVPPELEGRCQEEHFRHCDLNNILQRVARPSTYSSALFSSDRSLGEAV
jgi:hypothetical protein